MMSEQANHFRHHPIVEANMYEGITMKTIAMQAGCSVNTVSLALKGSPRISTATQQKIRKIADELNYVPHNYARHLVTKQSNTIGLILRDISSQILTTEARRIEQFLEQRGYILCIVTTQDDPQKEANAINLLLSNGVDGLIINTSLSQNIPKLEKLRKTGFPVILLSYPYESTKPINLDCIYPDLTQGGYIATRHLLNMGHRDILFVSNPLIQQSRNHKYLGYQNALIESNIIPDDSLVCHLSNYNLSKENMMDDILAKLPRVTAMLISRDEDAIPIIKYFFSSQVRIPEQLAIISIDNIPFAESAVISLSTVGYNYQNIAFEAVQRIISLLNGDSGDDGFLNISVPPTLYIRDSCGYRAK